MAKSEVSDDINKMNADELKALVYKLIDENKQVKDDNKKINAYIGKKSVAQASPRTLLPPPMDISEMGVLERLKYDNDLDVAILNSNRKGNADQVAARNRNIIKRKRKFVKIYSDLLSRPEAEAKTAAKEHKATYDLYRKDLDQLTDAERAAILAEIIKLKEKKLLDSNQ